jgi:hypothetical protein
MAPILTKTLFPAGNTQDICLVQSTLGLSNLVLNGNLASSGSVSFTALGYSRQVSFTSTNNLSSATFTIYGTQNGVAITENNITGPNNNTVYSANVYDTINAISVNGAVTAIQVGTGYLGFFNLITVGENLNNTNYTLSLGATIGSNQIPTAIWSTLDNISLNGSTFSNIITNNVGTLSALKSSSAVSLYILPNYPTVTTVPFVNQLLIQLIGTTSTISNSVTLIYRQIN